MEDQKDRWEPPGLRELVEKTHYLMPGWRIDLDYATNEGGKWLCLFITSRTVDSYDVANMINVRHAFLVPMATYNERTWKAWIRDRFSDVWDHEIGEMLTFNGVREFAPHHGNGEDPYLVWHIGDLADTQVRAGDFKE